jgi:hypothetical protein
MNSDAFKDIERLETDLREAADNLRANSKLTSSDYFMPVLSGKGAEKGAERKRGREKGPGSLFC